MVAGSHRRLTKAAVEGLLARLYEMPMRDECRRCECLVGFIAQLELDAADDTKPLLAKHKVPPKEVHACLGCEPCPPAQIFAEYLMGKRGR